MYIQFRGVYTVYDTVVYILNTNTYTLYINMCTLNTLYTNIHMYSLHFLYTHATQALLARAQQSAGKCVCIYTGLYCSVQTALYKYPYTHLHR